VGRRGVLAGCDGQLAFQKRRMYVVKLDLRLEMGSYWVVYFGAE